MTEKPKKIVGFEHVDTWVFDLDNTLYPPKVRLFDQIEERMTRFVMRELRVSRDTADRLRVEYFRAHGTTLAGLMEQHGVDPDPYLIDVHDISFDALQPDPNLAASIAALPGRKIIYTNGSAPYAAQVAERRGLSGLFDAIYGVEHADYQPKPRRAAFEAVFARDGLHPGGAAMFEDEARNLEQPHAMGMRTVHVAPAQSEMTYIDHHTEVLAWFLQSLM
ncbi:MAG: pyrimidine 5'-nucleotidase [Pseudomonadota bacterium]